MFSTGIIPGVGCQVVNGISATSGAAFVRAATRADFPTLVGPRTTTCPTPSLSIWKADMRWLAPFLA